MGTSGSIARDIADLTVLLTVLSVLVFLLVLVVLAVSFLRRKSSLSDNALSDSALSDTALADTPAEDAWGLSGRSSRWLILGGGVLLPTLVIAAVLGWTIETMIDITPALEDDALRVDVTGRQWEWDIAYAETGVETVNTLRIPVGRQVEVTIRAEDVIHSLWIPALAGKLDAIPGRTNTMILDATEPGEFRGQCAEFCGLGHARMEIVVVALPGDEFDEWLRAEASDELTGERPDG